MAHIAITIKYFLGFLLLFEVASVLYTFIIHNLNGSPAEDLGIGMFAITLMSVVVPSAAVFFALVAGGLKWRQERQH